MIELHRAAQRYSNDGTSLNQCPTNESDGEEQTDVYAELPLGNFLDDVALVTDMADNMTLSEGADSCIQGNGVQQGLSSWQQGWNSSNENDHYGGRWICHT